MWALLHFGIAARLARLTAGVRAFGEGKQPPAALGGGDEVGELSEAFSVMAAKLKTRETEQQKLEGEILEASERERQRIGHELHDGIGQGLTAALLATNGLSTELQVRRAFACEAGGRTGGSTDPDHCGGPLLRRRGLAPVPLWDTGLADALEALAETTSRTSEVRCVFDCTASVVVKNKEAAGHLYRIAQEAVNNALKHASPHEIRIGLERRDGELLLEIDDDGEGLPDTAAPGEGMGLRAMRHRAQVLGGIFEFGAAPAGGLRVSVQIPWPK